MNLRKIMVICLILCCILSIQAVAAGDNIDTNDTLSSTNDNVVGASDDLSLDAASDGEVLSAGGGSFTDLANEINGQSVVNLYQNYTYNDAVDSAFKRGISFRQGITIDGHGNTIDGSNMARIFCIGTDQSGMHQGALGPVILRNIQFINAYSTEGDQNTAFGAIEITGINPGTTFLLENCTFSNNKAPCAGAIAIGYFDTRDVTITNCTFDGNTATGQGGGAIRLWNNVNNLKIKDTTFKNNYAATYSGAVQMSSSGAGTVFDNCTFTSNRGESGAGAILSTFDMTIKNCTFRNNSGGSGGAIYSNGGNVVINRTNFYNNTATTEANNNGGGVIYKTSGNYDLTFDYCIFENNYAYHSGGVIYTLGSNTLINNSDAYNNKVKLDKARIGDTKEYNGGFAFVNGASNNFVCLNSEFDSSEAYKGGFFYFNNFNNNDKKILIDNCNFTNSYASWSGGAIRFENTIRFAYVYNSRFINGTAYREGGALSQNIDGYTFEYVNLTCINCTQIDTGRDAEGGGAIDIVAIRTSLKLENIDFINCSGNKRAGGLLFHGTRWNDNVPHILNNLYFENCTSLHRSGGQGGAIVNANGEVETPIISMNNITIINCAATHEGGAIYWNAYRYGNFNNINISNTHAGTYGGAIYWGKANSATISNINITNATSDSNGGAIYVNSNSVTVTNVNVTNSSAVNGGAIYWAGSNGILSNCNIIGNNASGNGGAVYFSSQSGKILSSNFTNNRATGNGGAVYVGKVSDVIIQDSTFKDSYAYNGGAVFYEGEAGASLYITNDTFIKNTASHNGGAVYYIVDNEGERTRVIYRDYLNFTKDGINSAGVIDPATGRTTVTMESDTGATYANRILNSYFENNMDYILDVAAESMPLTVGGIINISNPRDPNKNKYKVVINITNGDTLAANLTLNTTDDYETYYNEIYKKFIVNTRAGLVKNTPYNVTVGFEDSEYLYKQAKANFTTIDQQSRGDFHILQDLIEDAIDNHDGVLNLTRSYEFSYHLTFPEMDEPDNYCMNITRPITINGNGFSINALGYSRIFNITADNVVLNNIQFLNGESDGEYTDGVDKGGAIFWSGENGVSNNCTFRNNDAEYGGALYLNESALNNKISGCLFDRNDAEKNGGAIDCNAPGMNLTNTLFDENHAYIGAALCREKTATGGFGQYNNFTSNRADYAGAALAWINATSININHYVFIDNTAGYSGGAIYVGNGSGKCVVNNSYFEGNNVTGYSSGHGGAIEWYANNGTIINSTFINNNAFEGGAVFVGNESTAINITDSNFTKNNALQNGGAINVEGSRVTLNNTNFLNNTAAANGGALFIGGDGITNRIYLSTFEGNNATERGGAIDWSASAGHIEKSNFTKNFADYGGAIYLHGISSNTNITEVIFKYNNATHNGGAIDCNATGMNLTYTSFDFNYAGEYGAALCRESNATSGHGKYNNFTSNHAGIAGAALAWMNVSNINIDHYIFIDNTADTMGGAIYASVGSDNFTINNCDFKGNNVTNATGGHGGAIDTDSDNNTIKNSNFTNNNAFYGGAIFVGSTSGNTNITNVEFTRNNANVDGGAINLQSSGVKLNETRFYENTALRNGGAVYVGGNGTTNVIYNSEFKGNEAENNGGALYWRAYAGHIEYTNFTSNKAISGGAIYLNGVSNKTNITHVIFKGNNATKNGGAIDCNATRMNLTYTLFDSNYAGEYGAALCREVGATSGFGHHNNFTSNHAGIAGAALAWMNVSNINIDYYIFKDNTADAMGGAIYASQGSDNFTINHCDFKGNNITNSSDGYGGAIYSDSSNNTIKNSNLTNNNAFYGGGIYVGGDSGHTNITNVTFDRNNANVDGGAINLIASGVSLNDTRFYNNTAQRNGGAVYVGGTGTTNVIQNSGFVDNKANSHGGAIDWRASAGDIINTNFIKNSAEYGGAIYLNGISSGSKISHVYFGQNTATKNGGAIDCNATLMNLTHTKFVSNRADEYGAALCREAGATGGFGVNNTFDKNHAGISGAALAWLDVDDIKINNYTFTNNTADYSGGAIYVSYGSDNCKVYNSTFEDNYISNAIDGRGGAIDWVGDNGGIENTTFTRCISVNAGGVYVGARSHNMYIQNVSFTSCESLTNGGAIVIDGNNVTIANSNFTSSVARDNGGAIAGLSSDNGNITNCIFKYNVVGGHIDPQGNIYGEGGAIYWENSKNLTMYDNKFETNAARLSGGSISANNVSDSVIDKMFTHDETAFTDGGSIAWINSNNVTIKNGFFNDSGSNYKGGTLYFENVNATVKDTIINSTWASWGEGGAIYVAGNLTIDNVSFNDTHSDEDNATAIYFESGISKVFNSNFTNSINSIGIQKGANVTLTKNKLTAADPNKSMMYIKENTTYAASLVKYAVWNEGDLYLDKNSFDYVIFNNGTIWTKTTTKMLNNGSYEVEWNETFVFFANITDDNLNTIVSVKSLKATNDVYQDVGAFYLLPYNADEIRCIYQGVFHLKPVDEGLKQNTLFNGTLKVKMPVNLTVGPVDVTTEGVLVNVTLQPVYKSNYTIKNQNVTFKIYDLNGNLIKDQFNATITNINEAVISGAGFTFTTWTLANVSQSIKDNLNAGNYRITASYAGDDVHKAVENFSTFKIDLRLPFLELLVENIYWGQNATIIVNTNGTGQVLLFINGKTRWLNIVNGRAEYNETGLEPGNYSAVVTYPGDGGQYFTSFGTGKSFEVYKLNTTITATPTTPITVDDLEIITVEVNTTAGGFAKITINGKDYYTIVESGIATFTIPNLSKGEYVDIAVTYLGDKHFNENSTKTSFTVGATDDYNITVSVDNITYGQNATIYISLPISVSENLTVFVNTTEFKNVTVKNGMAKVIVPDLAVGTYIVNVTYPGDNVYAPKDKNGTKFKVTKSDFYAINVTAVDVKVDENTTITVHVPKDATGSVTIWVNGTSKVNSTIIDGVVTFTLNKTLAGKYEVNATLSDDNYTELTAFADYYVGKYETPIDIEVNPAKVGDQVDITVTVPKDVSNNVTIEVAGKSYNKTVDENGKAVFTVPSFENTTRTVVATYGGDRKYMFNSTTANFTVNKRDSQINVTAVGNTVGNNATITVQVQSNATGFVNVDINGTVYSIKLNSTGGGKLNVTGLGNGTYYVHATYLGDDQYKSSTNNTKTFVMSKVEPVVTIDVENVTYGNHTVIVVSVPGASGNVSIKINTTDKGQFTLVNGKVTFDAGVLGAENYTVYVSYLGDDKYSTKEAQKDFNVSKAIPTIKISDVSVDSLTNASVIVTINTDASGKLNITVNKKNYAADIEDGVATFTVDKLPVGKYDIVATYGGNDNYTKGSETLADGLTVTKGSSYKINVTALDVVVGENTTITVHVPKDATGNVTIWVNGTKKVNTTIDGVATFTLNQTKAGRYVVNATLSDDKYANKTAYTSYLVSKVDTPITITVTDKDNIKVGDTVTVTVDLPDEIVGEKVTIEINGKEYERVTGENGIATFTVPSITYGNKTVTAIYLGNNKYVNNATTANFTVNKRASQVNVTATGDNVGENAVISVKVPSNATGYVTVNVNGTDYTINLTSGEGSIDIAGLGNGTYYVHATYLGDDQYLTSTNNTKTFEMTKIESEISVTVEDIGSGVAKITVKVFDDATGNVTVKVNETVVTVGLVDGNAIAVIPNLEIGNYTVNVTYNGDRKYESSTNKTALEIKKDKIESDIVVIDQGNGTVVVVVGDNATGNVTITVGGHEYNATVINGTAVVYINNETPGKHNITVVYSGDNNHNATSQDANITSPKYDTEMTITVGEAKEGLPVTITVEVPQNATGNVTVYIDGKEYPGTIKDGIATVTVDGLTGGNKTVTVEYHGDNNYTANYTIDTFTVEKAKVTPDIVVVDNGNGTVVVVVGDNATGNVTIKVGDKEYNATVINGTAIVTLENITPGEHNITVIYSGDDNHNATNVNATVDGPKYDTVVDVIVTPEGQSATITVTVPENATGNVTVTIDGNEYPGIVEGGKVVVTVDNLTPGNKTVIVEYSGDDNYSANYTISNFIIEQGEIEPDIKVIDQGNGTVVVVVGDNATGNVTIKVGDKEYNATVINGTAVVTLENITPGEQNITVIYSGDDTHSNATVNTTVNGPKYDAPINVTVSEAKEGEPFTVTVEVPKDATGDVIVSVGGKDYPATIKDGKAVVTVENVSGGDHTIAVEYLGDDKYNGNYITSNVTVEAGKAVPEVIVVDQGNGTVKVIVGDNATGNVTITVDGQNYTAEVINGTAVVSLDNVTPGEHNITVIYSGDDKHNKTSANATIDVSKSETPISIDVENINVGDKAIIKVTVAEDVEGEITIEVDGKKYTKEVIGGVATFEVDNLIAGNKSVFAVFEGDSKYNDNYTSAQFNVSKVDSNLIVDITDAKVGENITITVNVPGDATGQVLIDIDGVGYYLNVTDGIGTVEIPRLTAGSYNVTLTYTGDDKYLSSTNATTVKVSKIESFVIPTAHNIVVGENENIHLIVPSDATGNVTVVIDGEAYSFNLSPGVLGAVYMEGEKYTVAISGGNGELVISGLPQGEYYVSVKYNGDEKYLPSTNSTIFTVAKDKTQMDVIDQGNGTIVVKLPGDATGNVTVNVDGEKYTAEVINGTAVVTLDKTLPGEHDVSVVYGGDTKYSSNSTAVKVEVPKYDTPISVDVSDINVGDTEVVTVTLPEGATGTVTIEINGVEYNASVENGKAVFNVEGLAFGNKTVAVKYSGDDAYNDNYTTGQFTVSKVPSKVKATPKDITVGKDEVITVTVPSDATGKVLVTIDGVGYYGDITNGKAKIIIPELAAGKYSATVTYEGDDKYLESSTPVTFTVSKVKAPVTAEADDIEQGEDATVIVHVPSDATGTVTIVVNGKTYTTPVVNGVAVFSVPGLTKGEYKITASYSGDDKYEANDNITDIEVHFDETPDDNGADKVSHEGSGVVLSSYPTGNPIMILLLILLSIGSTQIRRFKK